MGTDSIIRAVGVTKSFDGITAVANVQLTMSNGKITALAGGNGSGKTTLLKMLAGALKPDAGYVAFNDHKLPSSNVAVARATGIQMVYQDCSLCPDASVVENMFLGNEMKNPLGFLKRNAMRHLALEVIEQYDLPIPDTDATPPEMSGGQRKAVAIARALVSKPRFLLLDEPTSALGVREQATLLDIVVDLNAKGVGVCICTHSPDEILKVAARILIMRHGELVLDQPVHLMSKADLAIAMSS